MSRKFFDSSKLPHTHCNAGMFTVPCHICQASGKALYELIAFVS